MQTKWTRCAAKGVAIVALGLVGCVVAPRSGGGDASLGSMPPAPDASAPDGGAGTVDAGPSAMPATSDASAPDAGAPDVGSTMELAPTCDRECAVFAECGSPETTAECVDRCLREFSPLVDLGCAAPLIGYIDCVVEYVEGACRSLGLTDACAEHSSALRACRDDTCRLDPTSPPCRELCGLYCGRAPAVFGLDCDALCGSDFEDAHRAGCDASAWDSAICRTLGVTETPDGVDCVDVSFEIDACLARAR